MGAQAVQEPSMEEILASIRRIISEDDGGVAGDALDLADTNIHQDISLENQKSKPMFASSLPRENENVVTPLSASVFSDSSIQGTTVNSNDSSSREISREKIKMDGENGSDKNPFQEWNAPIGEEKTSFDPKLQFVNSQDEKNFDTISGLGKRKSAMNATESHDLPLVKEFGARNGRESVFSKTDYLPVNDDKRKGVEFGKELVSSRTNDAVSESFEQLKHLATDNLDDKVVKLLKPMLREWLDNNLPAMVERLVRNEIERVSRSE